MSKITKVVSRQVFDSRGIRTIETEIFCGKVSSKAICPNSLSEEYAIELNKKNKSNNDNVSNLIV